MEFCDVINEENKHTCTQIVSCDLNYEWKLKHKVNETADSVILISKKAAWLAEIESLSYGSKVW